MNHRDLSEEIQAHLNEKVAELMERGLSAPDARAQALREFGNRTLHLEDSRAVWLWPSVDRLSSDLRYALRGIRRSPGFTAVVVLTLALGIGANTAIFSAVNTVLIRPLPYPAADRLLWLTNYNPHFKNEGVYGPDYLDWRDQAHSVDAMMAYDWADKTLVASDGADQVLTAEVSGDFWTITGARPILGGAFAPGELNAIVLGYRLFEQRFHADPSIIGKTVTFDGGPKIIVGVMPRDFWFLVQTPLKEAEVYAPSRLAPANQVRGQPSLATVSVIARLKSGVSVETARVELDGIQSRIKVQWGWIGAAYDGLILRVLPLHDKMVENSRPALLVLMAAVGFVLLIACANVANLLLARSAARQKEISIRTALGAGRFRVARQFLTENLLLAFLGGATGLLLAHWAIQLLARFGPSDIPRLHQIATDSRMLLFTLAVSIVTGVLFGAGPAFSFSTGTLHDVLKESSRTQSSSIGARRVRALLAAVEIALALVLLTGAGLMVKSFWRMNQRPAGFSPDRTLVMKVTLSGPSYRSKPQQIAYYLEALRRLAAVPGVEAAGLGASTLRGPVSVDGVNIDPGAPVTMSTIRAASEGYMRAIGLRLQEGRWITDNEHARVVVVNQSFARIVAHDDHIVGKHTGWGDIVGIVADLKYSKLDADPGPEVYVPLRNALFISSVDLIVRGSRDPLAVAPELRKLVSGIDIAQTVYGVQTLEQSLAASVAPRRFNMLLLAIFAGIAVLLAAIGIYGIMSYAVTQRTQEIGVRMALGARQSEVIGMVVKQGMSVALAGVLAGLGCALWLTRLMASLLYNVQPWDGPTFAAACLSLSLAAFAACWIPARRAARVDPVIALRYE